MRILISGAGIAGPTLACHLAKTGARITVLEKTPSILPYGQNVDITGSALKVIYKMGLMPEIRRYNTTEKGTRFIDPLGRAFAPFPVKEGSQASLTSEFEILRGDLAKVLWEATRGLSNVEYVFGTTIKNVLENSENRVKVELSNGETMESDILVAADGQWSKVRKQCFEKESVEVVDKGMYAVYWTIPRIESDDKWWNIYHANGRRIITLRPDPHGTTRAMFTIMPCNEIQKKAWEEAARSDKQTQQNLLKREFGNAGWQAKRLLDSMDEAPDFYFQQIQQIKMTTWSNNRVICLGDTGYCPTPLTGMGTSLAITGAYVLAGELSKLKDNEHPSEAFKTYEAKFRPFVEEQTHIPFFFPGIAHPETRFQKFLLRALVFTLSGIARIPWVVKMLEGNNEEDFLLPKYECFEDERSKDSSSELSEGSVKSVF